MALSALDQALETASQMMTLARPAATDSTTVAVDEWMASMVRRLKPALSHDVMLIESWNAPDVSIDIEPSRLDQVFVNLLLNANDAAGPAATIALRSSIARDESGAEYVQLEVEDDGPGVSEQVKATIFEPFVTTKAGKGGTGLGLAVSRGIVQAHDGSIAAHSRVGEYAEFVIVLPARER